MAGEFNLNRLKETSGKSHPPKETWRWWEVLMHPLGFEHTWDCPVFPLALEMGFICLVFIGTGMQQSSRWCCWPLTQMWFTLPYIDLLLDPIYTDTFPLSCSLPAPGIKGSLNSASACLESWGIEATAQTIWSNIHHFLLFKWGPRRVLSHIGSQGLGPCFPSQEVRSESCLVLHDALYVTAQRFWIDWFDMAKSSW